MPVEFPEVVAGDAIRVSASLFVTYKRCPEQAGARFQGIYGPDTRPAFLGSLAHRIFSRHLSTGAIAPEDFARVCREEIGASGLNNKLGAVGNKPSVLNAVIEETRALYERFVKLPEEGFEGAERALEATPGDGVTLVGTVDAVYREDLGGHRLVDWKTGELGDADDQLLFYGLLWALGTGEVPAYVEAISVRTGERMKREPTQDDLQQTADEVGQMVSAVRTAWASGAGLPRTGGPWCRYCPILPDCDEGRSVGALLDGALPEP